MNWLLFNKTFSFVGPKIRALYVSFTPTSLFAVFGVNHLSKGHVDVNVAFAMVFYFLSAATYVAARFVNHLFCPESIRGINSEQEFMTRQAESIKKAKALVENLREIEEEKIRSELMGALPTPDAERLAGAIAKRQHSVIDILPDISHSMKEHSGNKPALFVCALLIVSCGVFWLASVWVVAAPVLWAMATWLRGIR